MCLGGGRALALPLAPQGRVCMGSNHSCRIGLDSRAAGVSSVVSLSRLSSLCGDQDHFACIAPPILSLNLFSPLPLSVLLNPPSLFLSPLDHHCFAQILDGSDVLQQISNLTSTEPSNEREVMLGSGYRTAPLVVFVYTATWNVPSTLFFFAPACPLHFHTQI